MKTKDYSRELCEICGIEAKQFIKDFKQEIELLVSEENNRSSKIQR